MRARPRRGSPPPGLAVRVAHGDDSYIVGEETALLESLEGRRPWPRPKPPLPAAVGFEGRPTLVHNVETLARLPDGARRSRQPSAASETTFVSLWGDVRRPGLYEVRLGTPLRSVIEEQGGGAPTARRLRLPRRALVSALARRAARHAPRSRRAARRGLVARHGGAAGVSGERQPFDLAVSLAAFFERESCGQCPPCVRGTESLHKVARALRAGTARASDVT